MSNNQAKRCHQQGFSLLEVLIAALLFAVSLLGLLHYHQVLLQSFQRQWQYQQAWSLAHLQLEMLDANLQKPGDSSALPLGWRSEVDTLMALQSCLRYAVIIETPLQQRAELSRWYCSR
ncbi:prepilin-type N-terminal cleavage/methylation domain-containing protein [Serratia sp. UGAL515B_01]|uniref:type IV pilus modification PilV family protein n=1 Tax=Serratia sp. UGAL515B_01 TaxID=2986763 RepID=UPI002952CE4D|nr:prepilin-type N-terminal cleavage/methylation domain-containing protein [Serratia sp. UGAL515B_01]WON76016.1 prepilin-type N-terminal cleavage/methylation domain-containing protein [Serratia sp. UGAL515B_01]